MGFRVVLDVVYNHLHGSGPFDENSVLDKVIIRFLCSICTLLFKWCFSSLLFTGSH